LPAFAGLRLLTNRSFKVRLGMMGGATLGPHVLGLLGVALCDEKLQNITHNARKTAVSRCGMHR
jgi:hypothetical protein